jgi:hypothetical protein
VKSILQSIQFIFVGLFTAAVGEWQFSVFLRSDLQNIFGSLAFNTLYLAGVTLLTCLFITPLRRQPRWILLYAACGGISGLAVEWFLIGNSPWGNPDANQLGMFAYWACMSLVPLMFLLQKYSVQAFILRYGLIYLVLACLGQVFITSPAWRFAFHIYAVILGYLGLMLVILWFNLRPEKSRGSLDQS